MNKIEQAYISQGLKFFRSKFLSKFNLKNYHSKDEPVAMFSICRDEDYKLFESHRGEINIIWCGSDAMLINKERAKILKSKRVRHISTSKFISQDLSSHEIEFEYIPVSAAENSLSGYVCPRGENIYFYHDNNFEKNFYGQSHIEEIKRKTGLNIIQTTKNSFNSTQLIDVYRSCFVALRLTKHDGIPTSVTEMGLMGRRSIHNGSLPHCYEYENINDICDYILEEYENRHINDVKTVSEDWKNYINREDWLYV